MAWVRRFDDGDASQRELLGGKGANLAEMTRMGLPVPPGVTITTEACRAWSEDGGTLPDGLLDELRRAIDELGVRVGRRFGAPDDPLLLSVRSGAPVSMPGMMDTVLNLGLTTATRDGFAARVGERVADDALRRVHEMYGHVVLGVPDATFAAAAAKVLAADGANDVPELSDAGLAALATAYGDVVEAAAPGATAQDPWDHLVAAVTAVFASWNGRRARDYRRIEGITDDLGTAVNVQVMVFGNAGPDSGTGVAFTRDPATGDPRPVGDFLVDAQGEDVVAGVRNTRPLSDLADVFPAAAAELEQVMGRLEGRYRDMCDLEFTVEHERLFVLQTRVGKRTAAAALRMAVDMVDEALIDRATAVQRVRPVDVDRLLHPQFAAEVAPGDVLTAGLGASPGAASGQVVLEADDAVALANAGVPVVLVRPQTSPDDVHGIAAAEGILTSRGGLVSHAAVVARGIGTPAVCGAADVVVDPDLPGFRVGDATVREGELVSIDGTSGVVVRGAVPVVVPESPPELGRVLGWADEIRRLRVWANADTGADATAARAEGAEGIGLCRTEHQFLGDRLPIVQAALLATTGADRDAAMARLHDVQRVDFRELLLAMDGLPVTVRLLDPPLHEFLPDLDQLRVSDALGTLAPEDKAVYDAAVAWREDNPMLGVRGVRLGLLRPEIYAMQVRALAEAALELAAAGHDPQVRVMIPLVVSAAELGVALDDVRATLDEVWERAGRRLEVPLGAMVETPRAAVLAGTIAPLVDFLSFGTNDLTQMTFGFSRDDVEPRLVPRYLELGILADDPFRTLDVEGVGALVRTAVEAARATNPDVEVGVCGEHGGDPASIAFFDACGFDEVSCSAPRVLVARLAAARAALTD